MSDRQLAEIVCRALLAIVAGIRKRYGLPSVGMTVIIQDSETATPAPVYEPKI
jgi:hypothetical protein